MRTFGREVVPLVCKKRAMSEGTGTPCSPGAAVNAKLQPGMGVMVHVGAPDASTSEQGWYRLGQIKHNTHNLACSNRLLLLSRYFLCRKPQRGDV